MLACLAKKNLETSFGAIPLSWLWVCVIVCELCRQESNGFVHFARTVQCAVLHCASPSLAVKRCN